MALNDCSVRHIERKRNISNKAYMRFIGLRPLNDSFGLYEIHRLKALNDSLGLLEIHRLWLLMTVRFVILSESEISLTRFT